MILRVIYKIRVISDFKNKITVVNTEYKGSLAIELLLLQFRIDLYIYLKHTKNPQMKYTMLTKFLSTEKSPFELCLVTRLSPLVRSY